MVRISRARDGKDEEIVIFHSGDFFGEVGLFRDVLRTATATAVKQVVLFEISRNEFNNFVLKSPHVGVKILYYMVGEMAKRLRSKNREGEDLAF